MSTNWQYTSVPSQDLDLDSRYKQSDSTSEVYSPQNTPNRLHQGLDDDSKPNKENDYQSFTNTEIGDILQIPNWPGPRKLEKTLTESLLIDLGYVLCLVPPLFFFSRDIICTLRSLNRADFVFYSTSIICYRSTLEGGERVWKSSPSGLSSGELFLL
jgi:hypothetical protein